MTVSANDERRDKDRTPAFDLQMVRDYLEDFGHIPSIGTMEKTFKPSEARADAWASFLRENWNYKLQRLREAMPNGNVLMEGLGPAIPLKKLFLEHSRAPIELEQCEVVSISEVKPYDEWVRYVCRNCHDVYGPYSKLESYEKPRKCNCDRSDIVESTDPFEDSIDSQWIKIQELHTESTDVPQFLDCLLKGRDMMWAIGFQERVSLIGMLRYTRVKEKDGSSTYRKWFEVYGVRKVDPDASIPLTDEDIAYIQREQRKPDFLDKLVASYAPHIKGMNEFKEAILLTLASIKLPRPGRLLMVTDPSMGKSELLQYTVSLIPTAQHTQMGRSSNAGLTLSSEQDKETGRRFVMRGAAAAAHNSLLCIDELQIGREEHFKNLNDLLESGKVRYAMAGGFRGQMNANCALIMSCNPNKGRFIGEDERLEEVLEFMGNDLPQFISRINLILMKRDNSTAEEEKEIVRHMARHNPNDPNYLFQYRENWFDEHNPEEEAIQTPLKGFMIIVKSFPERYGTKWIRKIIKYVSTLSVDQLSEQHQDMLVEYYMRNRSDLVTAMNKIVTKRFIRHAITTSQFMARLQGKRQPSDADIQRCITLLEKTMSVAAWNNKNKTFETNLLEGNYSEQHIETEEKVNKTKQFNEAIKMAMKDEHTGQEKNFFTLQELQFKCQMLPNSKWMDEDKVEKEVQRLHDKGKLAEFYGQGKYTPIN